jgi:hypothetical protein
VGMWNIVNKSDEELLRMLETAEVADQVLVLEQELIRKGLLKLNESSGRLEASTKTLVGLTRALLALTALLLLLTGVLTWFTIRLAAR